jgi:hypothetical protein
LMSLPVVKMQIPVPRRQARQPRFLFVNKSCSNLTDQSVRLRAFLARSSVTMALKWIVSAVAWLTIHAFKSLFY